MFSYGFDRFDAHPDLGVERLSVLTGPLDIALPANHRLAQSDRIAQADLRGEEWGVGRDGSPSSLVMVELAQASGFEPRTTVDVTLRRHIFAMIRKGSGRSPLIAALLEELRVVTLEIQS